MPSVKFWSLNLPETPKTTRPVVGLLYLFYSYICQFNNLSELSSWAFRVYFPILKELITYVSYCFISIDNRWLAVKCSSSLVVFGFSRNKFNSYILFNFCCWFYLFLLDVKIYIYIYMNVRTGILSVFCPQVVSLVVTDTYTRWQ